MRGTVRAAGFLIDTTLIGEAEASRRVVEYWQDGATLRATADGSWLVLLPAPVDVRHDRAPGFVLTADAITGDTVVLPRHPVSLDQLAEIEPELDLGPLPVHRLAPIQAPPRVDVLPPVPAAVKAPDLRTAAAIGSPVRRKPRVRAATSVRSTTPTSRLRGRTARAVLASPFRPLIARRQLAYLERVERSFRHRDWDQALREAIPLGGPGGVLSLALPRARQGPLSPSDTLSGGGRALAVSGIGETFAGIYRRAAAELERSGDIEKAAFVLADLLDTPIDAVHLLERHRLYRLAARLAEGRGLEPALIVRLWWRAGDRQRAVDIAQLRGAFAAALDRLGDRDEELSRQLRAAWVQARRDAGDYLGALAAAWPDTHLRPAAMLDIQHVLRFGGPPAAHALAYLLNHATNEQARDTAVALLANPDAELNSARGSFLTAFAELPAADPIQDRQLATAAVRAITRDGYAKSQRSVFDHLSRRADRVTVADLPKPPTRATPALLNHTCPPMPPGDLPVYDAAWLGDRLLLAHGGHGVRLVKPDGGEVARWDTVAHRIVTADSGTRAMLVAVAQQTHELHELDLITPPTSGRGEAEPTVRRPDAGGTRRRVTRWAAVRASAVAGTYDGSVLTVVDEDGIAFLTSPDGNPRLIWRELDRQHQVALLERTSTSLSALLRVPPTGNHELWQWDLSSISLRQRPSVDLTGIETAVLLADGHLVALEDSAQRHLLLLENGQRRRQIATAAENAALIASGNTYALIEPHVAALDSGTDDGDWTGARTAAQAAAQTGARTSVTIRHGTEPRPLAQLQVPGPISGIRPSPGRVTVWDRAGRVIAVNLARASIDSDFRTRIR